MWAMTITLAALMEVRLEEVEVATVRQEGIMLVA
jgi:hypothetical protein